MLASYRRSGGYQPFENHVTQQAGWFSHRYVSWLFDDLSQDLAPDLGIQMIMYGKCNAYILPIVPATVRGAHRSLSWTWNLSFYSEIESRPASRILSGMPELWKVQSNLWTSICDWTSNSASRSVTSEVWSLTRETHKLPNHLPGRGVIRLNISSSSGHRESRTF